MMTRMGRHYKGRNPNLHSENGGSHTSRDGQVAEEKGDLREI